MSEDFLRPKVSVVVQNHHRPDRIRRVSFWRIRATESFEEVFGAVLMGRGVSEDFLRSKVVGRSFEIIIVRIGFVG